MCIGYKSVKIPIDVIVKSINNLDTDKDGCLSVGECLNCLKELAHRLKAGNKND